MRLSLPLLALCFSGTLLYSQRVDTAIVLKFDVYAQSAKAAPAYQGSAYLLGFELAEPLAELRSSTALITGPGFSSRLNQISPTGLSVTRSGSFTTRATLDSAAPDGEYHFSLVQPPIFEGSITLSGGNYPPVAAITNLADLQSIPGNTATIEWNLPAGTLASDVVAVSLTDETHTEFFTTPGLGEEGALDGRTNRVTVPLAPGQELLGTVTVIRPVNAASVPQGDLLAGYATATAFSLRSTAARDVTRPRVIAVTPASGAYGIDPTAEIELTFDEPMREQGLLRGDAAPSSATKRQHLIWNQDRRSVRIRWPLPLAPGPVTFTADSSRESFSDLSGNLIQPGTVASFFVGDLPVITQQPVAPAEPRPGQTVRLTGAAVWPGRQLSYQWYRGGQPVAGANAATLELVNFKPEEGGIFELVVTNENGSVRTKTALLVADLSQEVSPHVSIGAFNTNVTYRLALAPGVTTWLSSRVLGSADRQLQWRRNGTPIPGATAASLPLDHVNSRDEGVYDLLVIRPYGTVASNPLELVITPDIALPKGSTVRNEIGLLAGESYILSGYDTGAFTLLKSWRLNGQPIAGATDPSYQITAFSAAKAGVYTYVISNSRDEWASTEITVKLRDADAPFIAGHPQSVFFTERSGDNISVSALGRTPMTYQWRRDGVNLAGENSLILSIRANLPEQAGTYTCVVSNAFGQAESKPATVSFISERVPPPKPIITSGRLFYTAGEMIALTSDTPARGSAIDRREWQRAGTPIPNGTMYYLQVPNAQTADSGSYRIVNYNSYGTTASDPVEVTVLAVNAAPVITADPVELTVQLGEPLRFLVSVAGGTDRTYRWFLDGREVTSVVSAIGAPANEFYAPSAQPWHAGHYSVEVSSSTGTVSGPVATIIIPPLTPVTSSHLVNLSTRALAGTGDHTLIAGFVIAGKGPKQLVLRAVGDGLAKFGVDGNAQRARLTVYRKDTVVASNAGWTSRSDVVALATTFKAVGAFLLDPALNDSAILADFAPGTYSAHVQAEPAVLGGDGVGLFELYDADPGFADSRLVNLSSRVYIGSNAEQIAIPGLVVAGQSPKTYLIRIVGPGLVPFDVSDALANPRLRLVGPSGMELTNDNWEKSEGVAIADIVAATRRVGGFDLAPGSKDAALLITLKPGRYSVLASSADNATGVVLVEVYEVP